MVDEHTELLDEIEELLAVPPASEPEPLLRKIEHTLTSGYARALALEAEQRRLEHRIGEAAAKVGDGADEVPPKELARLARRKSSADGDLKRLRQLLRSLRARAREVRAS